jgi:catechol 2,3-dioxygenase-like lactoylglutathione lyase family enzyme
MYSIHHVAVTASNFEQSLEFYKKLGFEVLADHQLPESRRRLRS